MIEINDLDKEIIRMYSDYLLFEKRVSMKTKDVYSNEASVLLSFIEKNNLDISSIDFSSLVSFMDERRKASSLDDRTLSKILSSLRSFFSFCVKEGYRKDNPAGNRSYTFILFKGKEFYPCSRKEEQGEDCFYRAYR